MDQIDQNLFNAWERIAAICRRDPAELKRRALRQLGRSMNQGTQNVIARAPMTPWCLQLRASDTRMSAMNCYIEPLTAGETSHLPAFPYEMPAEALRPFDIDDDVEDLITQHRVHRLTIPGETIRELMKPITIPWPGEDWKRVAQRCGVSKDFLKQWMEKGVVKIERRVPARTVGRRGNRGSRGSRGRPVPIVYTPSPIDPNAFNAAPPDRMWGTLWQGKWQRLPEAFEQSAVRVPRYRMLRQAGLPRVDVGLPRAHDSGWGISRMRADVQSVVGTAAGVDAAGGDGRSAGGGTRGSRDMVARLHGLERGEALVRVQRVLGRASFHAGGRGRMESVCDARERRVALWTRGGAADDGSAGSAEASVHAEAGKKRRAR